MFAPLIGIETIQNINNQLVYRTRWPLLFLIVAIVAVGRLLLVLFIRPYLRARRQSDLVQIAVAPSPMAKYTRFAVPVGAAASSSPIPSSSCHSPASRARSSGWTISAYRS